MFSHYYLKLYLLYTSASYFPALTFLATLEKTNKLKRSFIYLSQIEDSSKEFT